jgi:hypothetical protein
VEPTILFAAVLATSLMIGRVELNSEHVENLVQVLCRGCNSKIKSGIQCESYGRWYHNRCVNVKFQVAESGK